MADRPLTHRQTFRLGIALLLGAGAGLLGSIWLGIAQSVVLSWLVAAAVFGTWTWLVLTPMSPEQTRDHARGEDPGSGLDDIVLLVASLASIVGLGVLLAGASDKGYVSAALGLLAVAGSWVVIPTMYAVRYADLYYSGQGDDEIDFGDDGNQPDYRDFAYLSFTLAMTYQVSDTALTSKQARRLGLKQSLLGWFFGAVIVAAVVNLLASLAN